LIESNPYVNRVLECMDVRMGAVNAVNDGTRSDEMVPLGEWRNTLPRDPDAR
jgi:hypothetical protein